MLPKNTILKPGHMMDLIWIIYFTYMYLGNMKEAGGHQGPLPLDHSCFNSEKKNYVPSVRNGLYQYYLPNSSPPNFTTLGTSYL